MYQGEWKNDLKNGKGVYTMPNGDFLEADWVDGESKEKGQKYKDKIEGISIEMKEFLNIQNIKLKADSVQFEANQKNLETEVVD